MKRTSAVLAALFAGVMGCLALFLYGMDTRRFGLAAASLVLMGACGLVGRFLRCASCGGRLSSYLAPSRCLSCGRSL